LLGTRSRDTRPFSKHAPSHLLLQEQHSECSQEARTSESLQCTPSIRLLRRANGRRRSCRGRRVAAGSCCSRSRDLAGLEERALRQDSLGRAVIRAVEPNLVCAVDRQSARGLHHVFEVGGRHGGGEGGGGDGGGDISGAHGGRHDERDFRDGFGVLVGVGHPGYGLGN
jgi:hypothetical protein